MLGFSFLGTLSSIGIANRIRVTFLEYQAGQQPKTFLKDLLSRTSCLETDLAWYTERKFSEDESLNLAEQKIIFPCTAAPRPNEKLIGTSIPETFFPCHRAPVHNFLQWQAVAFLKSYPVTIAAPWTQFSRPFGARFKSGACNWTKQSRWKPTCLKGLQQPAEMGLKVIWVDLAHGKLCKQSDTKTSLAQISKCMNVWSPRTTTDWKRPWLTWLCTGTRFELTKGLSLLSVTYTGQNPPWFWFFFGCKPIKGVRLKT